jgi:hypothetical protein
MCNRIGSIAKNGGVKLMLNIAMETKKGATAVAIVVM